MNLRLRLGLLGMLAASIVGCGLDPMDSNWEAAPEIMIPNAVSSDEVSSVSPDGIDQVFVQQDEFGTSPPAPVHEAMPTPVIAAPGIFNAVPSVLAEPTDDFVWEPLNAGDTAEKPQGYREVLPPYQSLPAEQVVPKKKSRS